MEVAGSYNRWSGDPASIMPPEFQPVAAKKGDIIERKRALGLFGHLVANDAAAVAFALVALR